MDKYDLSVLIPARNEQFLARTVEDALSNIRGKTEIIVVLDGEWADPALPDNDRLRVIFNHESVGQRAATNQAARLSRAKYVMKVDAHCAFDEGFDVKMIEGMKDNWTCVPVMYNLHAFDWVCESCKFRKYQGPTPIECEKCKGKMVKEMIWKPRLNKKNTSYLFDKTLHFQYWGDYKKVQATQGEYPISFSLQGSCFMLTRKKYWELDISEEAFGSWGQQGTEVACKTWLSGGEVHVNMKTWYSHMFRTQGGDFGFPYPLSQRAVDHAREYSRDLFLNNKWKKAIHPFSWLIEKFKPIPYWHDNINQGTQNQVPSEKNIIYFTDNQLNIKIAKACQKQLSSVGLPIISASLKPMTHFGVNVHLPLIRGYATMFEQILSGLKASKAKYVFLCEHDVLYHPSHFDFTPKERGVIYYNINVWKVRSSDGHALWVNNCVQVSGICAFREDLLKHYQERVKIAKENPKWDRNWGFEPGTPGKTIFPTHFSQQTFMSSYPNIDIRHDHNLTLNRWEKRLFRDKKNCEGWTESNISKMEGWNFENGLLNPSAQLLP